MPDPSEFHVNFNQLVNYQNTLLERHQESAFEFWLDCRELVARHRWEYWQARADFLERTQRRGEAAQAFREELNCRLGLLRNSRNVPNNFVPRMRARSEQWLLSCMTPQLRTVGLDIYNTLVRFASQSGTQGGSLVPRNRRIHEYYGESQDSEPRDVPTEPGRRASEPLPDLSSTLVRIAGACFAGLRDVSHLTRFHTQLDELVRALKSNGKSASADSLERMLKEWDDYGHGTDKSARHSTLQRAQEAFADFRGALQRELSPEEQTQSGQLLASFDRVSTRLARALELVPELSVEGIVEAPPEVDPTAELSAFAVRVSSSPGSIPVRLTGATATLEDGATELRLRGNLVDIPVIVEPERSAVLSFAVDRQAAIQGPRSVEIALQFDLEGATYRSVPTKLLLASQPCPPLPEDVPYIWGRPIDPSEIEAHFFGRGDEQKQILDSVRDGQQQIRYVEGIRRSGKSSLLNSVIYEVEKRKLPLIPVYVTAASVGSLDEIGKILHVFLVTVARHPQVTATGVIAPSEVQCCSNATLAYSGFAAELAAKLPDQRVVILLDDFQTLVAAAGAARERNPGFARGVVGLLNLIRSQATPSAHLLWVFAGQEAFRKYREHLPGALVWGDGRPLQIDFLDAEAVGQILERPLESTPVRILPETIARFHLLTGGHPEVVQQMAELVWLTLAKERRLVMTPADADEAAVEIAETTDTFADTWYPQGELKREQKAFIASLINAVPVGGSVEPFRLLPNNALTDAAKMAIDDLVARKILVYRADGTLSIRAYVLDLWLHRYIPSSITEVINGSIAIFIDVANLTSGKGSAVLTGLNTDHGDDGIPGRFRLTTVIDKIERYAQTLSPAPVAARWVANYPPRSDAVLECNDRGYQVENIPSELFSKGSDDLKLREKMWDVEQGYPNVNHFLVVTGDKDYSLAVDKLLRDGKFVHLIARETSMARHYEYLAESYPERFTAMRLEEVLESY